MPWTIQRATQFHDFVLKGLKTLEVRSVAIVPKGFLLQPVDVGDIASRLVELALWTFGVLSLRITYDR